jgi:hypothetical protein
MTSLRHTALVWMTVLLAVVGAVAIVISYELARSEAAGFLDGRARLRSMSAGGCQKASAHRFNTINRALERCG